MMGIYKIKNLVNGKVYIGQSVNIESRWYGHIRKLKNNSHSNKHLQSAWNKYGEENFKFEVVEECEEEKLTEREQYWIDYYGGMEDSNNYNNKDAGIHGRPSNEVKLKYRNAHLGKIASQETRLKMSKVHKGKIFTQEEREHISKGLKDYYKNNYEAHNKIGKSTRKRFEDNPELKNIISEIGKSQKGRKHTEEELQKMRGRKMSVEVRQKMSESRKGINHPLYGKHHSEETKEKMRKPKHTEESRKKISEAVKSRVISDETRKKLSESVKASWERRKLNGASIK